MHTIRWTRLLTVALLALGLFTPVTPFGCDDDDDYYCGPISTWST